MTVTGNNSGIIAPGAENSPMIVAPNASRSVISITQQNQEVRTLIQELTQAFKAIESKLPPDERAIAATHLRNLEKAAEAKDRPWYSISAQGLLDASKFVKDFAANIVGTLTKAGKALWPDFELKKRQSSDGNAE